MPAPTSTPSQAHSVDRRKLLKILAAAGGALGAASLLPGGWFKPVVKVGVLPVHAQASPTPEPSPSPEPTAIPGSITFDISGTGYTWAVPAGVTSITVDAYGAQGGMAESGYNGAWGGHVQATLAVTPGEALSITVAGQGQIGSSGIGGTGGIGGGGHGGNGHVAGGGGGGASWLRRVGSILISVGGGGGSTSMNEGGAGGGTTGEAGGVDALGGSGGGTGSGNGGAGGVGSTNGGAGSDEMGGSGADSVIAGGGGGAGYSAGGGGASAGGGGGGASYIIAGAMVLANEQGVRSGDGAVTISWG